MILIPILVVLFIVLCVRIVPQANAYGIKI